MHTVLKFVAGFMILPCIFLLSIFIVVIICKLEHNRTALYSFIAFLILLACIFLGFANSGIR